MLDVPQHDRALGAWFPTDAPVMCPDRARPGARGRRRDPPWRRRRRRRPGGASRWRPVRRRPAASAAARQGHRHGRRGRRDRGRRPRPRPRAASSSSGSVRGLHRDLRVGRRAPCARRIRDRDRRRGRGDLRGTPAAGVRAFVEGCCSAATASPAAPRRRRPTPARVVLLASTAEHDGRGDRAAIREAWPPARPCTWRVTWPTPRRTRSRRGGSSAQAEQVAREHGLGVQVRGRDELDAQGFGGLLAVGGGSAAPAGLVELTYAPRGRRAGCAAHRAGRQGHHLRHRWAVAEAARLHGADEDRHERSAAVIADDGCARPSSACRFRVIGLLAIAENMPSGSAHAARRRHPALRRHHRRGAQHRCRGPAGAGRRAGLRRRRARSRRPRRRRDADRRGHRSASVGVTARCTPPSSAARPAMERAAQASGRAGVADAAGPGVRRRAGLRHRRPVPHLDRPEGRRRLDHGGAVPAASSSATAQWVHLDIAGPGAVRRRRGTHHPGGTGYGTASLIRWVESFDDWPRRRGASADDGGEQTVADRQQHRDEALVVADRVDERCGARSSRGRAEPGRPPGRRRTRRRRR